MALVVPNGLVVKGDITFSGGISGDGAALDGVIDQQTINGIIDQRGIASPGVSGFMSGEDNTKLAGIETGATADLSGSEIADLLDAHIGTNTWQTGVIVSLSGNNAESIPTFGGPDSLKGYNNFTFDGSTLVVDNITVNSDLNVNGTQNINSSSSTVVTDPFSFLNGGVTGDPDLSGVLQSGISINRGTSDSAMLVWNEPTDTWQVGLSGGTFNNLVTDNQLATGSNNGLMISSDKTKLDTIETGATADQTAGEIKSLYESNANTNAFTDSLLSKLNSIETGATGDQTGSEIVSLLDGQLGSSNWRSEVSDAGYSDSWNGVTTDAPSKNAVYDKIQSMISDVGYSGSWNGVSTVAPSKNAVYDRFESVYSTLNGKLGNSGTTNHSGTIKFTGASSKSSIVLEGNSPTMKFEDTDHDDFWIHVNSSRFYILRGNTSTDYPGWSGTHAFELRNADSTGYIYGQHIQTRSNAVYNTWNSWLRDNSDNANVKLYGNSRQMVFRTDGTSQYATGVGNYPFAWMYGGDSSGNRRMLLNTSGQLWCSNYGWLHDKFLDKTAKAADSDKLDGYDWMQSGKDIRGKNIYADDWFRNYNAGEGIYNQATGCHFESPANEQWRIRDSGNSIRLIFATNGTTNRGSLYANSSSQIGILNTAGQWHLRSNAADGQSPNLWFVESGNETWTGNPGNDHGKIEYHSNRFYLAAGSNTDEHSMITFRHSGSDVAKVSRHGYFRSATGASTTPSHSFTTDTDTGMYRKGDGEIGLTCNSQTRLSIGSYGIDVTGNISTGSRIYNGGGSSSEPSFSFEVETDIGMYRSATGELGFAANGSKRATIGSGGLALQNGTRISEFSTDTTLGGNSDNAVPTEKAVRTYVDNQIDTFTGDNWSVSNVDVSPERTVTLVDDRTHFFTACGAGNTTSFTNILYNGTHGTMINGYIYKSGSDWKVALFQTYSTNGYYSNVRSIPSSSTDISYTGIESRLRFRISGNTLYYRSHSNSYHMNVWIGR